MTELRQTFEDAAECFLFVFWGFFLKNLQYSFIKHLPFAGLREPSENSIRHEHDMSYKFGSCPI